MSRITRLLCCALFASCFVVAQSEKAEAQYPGYYGPVVPSVGVVGYSARRGGLLGQRVVVRPVVGTVPVPVARPVYVQPYVAARPVVAVPAVTRAYYAPPVRVAVPVTSYRVPVTQYVPVYGY